jgi:hypothetical protein
VQVPDKPETELVLATPDMGHDAETAAAIRELVTKGGGNGLIFSVDDCRKTYEELLEKGVEFTHELTEHFYSAPRSFARLSDAARRRVLQHERRQVADRDDAHEIVALDHGQMAEAAVEHQDDRVLGRVVGADRLRMGRHAVGDARVVAETTRDGAQDVALGQDPGQPAMIQHEDRADVAVDHPLGDFDDRHVGLDG